MKKEKEKYVIRKPTLRAREQFLRIEKEYEDVLQRSLDIRDLLRFLTAEEIKTIQTGGEIPESVLDRLLKNEDFLQRITEGMSVDEELRYTRALYELAKCAVDWDVSSGTEEDLLDEPLSEIYRIVSFFRASIGRR